MAEYHTGEWLVYSWMDKRYEKKMFFEKIVNGSKLKKEKKKLCV